MASTITSKEYTGNGSTTEFTYAFQSYQLADVKVKVNEVAVTNFTIPNYTASGGTVTFNNTGVNSDVCESDGAPKNTLIVRVYRETDITSGSVGEYEAKATYVAGSSIKAADLNNCAKQALYATFENRDQEIQTAKIRDGAITRVKIEADAIDGTKIADDAINSEHIVDGSVDLAHLSADSVDGTKIADDSINSEHYVDGSIDTAHIANLQVTGPKIADDTIGAVKLQSNSVTTAKIATDAVTNVEIAGDTIQSSNIADLQITTAKIAADAVDGTKIADNAIGAEHIAANAVGTSEIADAELTTLAGMQSGTASILAGGTALTSTLTELNMLDGKSIVTSISNPTDNQLPTAQAVEERIVDLVTDVGGFVPIANETSFPATNPDPGDNAGTIVSVKALASNLTSNGSGVATIANGAGSGNTVTINGMANSDTIEAGKGILVETTSTLHTYTFHRETLAPADITTAKTAVDDFNNRYRILASGTNINTVGSLDDGDLLWDSNVNKMKVYDASASTWSEVTSVGDYKLLTVVNDGQTSGSPTYNGSIVSYDLRDGSNAASITSVGQLLVSLNGVLQKPNSGSWSASNEGFHLEGTNGIKFCTAPPSGSSVFVTLIGSATSVNVPATNSIVEAAIQTNVVSEEKLKISNAGSNGQFLSKQSGNSGGLTWADVPAGVGGATGVDFNDDVKARFGTGNDLELYHNGTNSYINNGEGDLWIKSNGDDLVLQALDDVLIRPQDGENGIKVLGDGGVELYYDNAKKFETVTGGATITGTCTATSFAGDGSSLTGVDSSKADGCIWENDQTISNNYTIAAGKGAHSVGPLTVNATVTVNGVWVIS